jgi:hypothetical protein
MLIPIAVTVTSDGEIVRLQRIQPIDGSVDTPELVEEILRALRKLAIEKKVRAVAWCVDMRVVPPGATSKSDALVLFCESLDQEPMVVVSPYRDAPGPGTTFADSYVQNVNPQVFGAAQTSS